MNAITDQSIITDERFIKKKRELSDQLVDNILLYRQYNTTLLSSQETSLDNTERRIIDIIKKGVEMRKNALNDELNAFREYISEMLEEKNRLWAEDDYEKNLKKEQQSLMDIQEKINRLLNDTSIEGIQRRRELEKQYADQQERIDEMQLGRRRDLERQNLNDIQKDKEQSIKEALELLDEMFSEENIKYMAHQILLKQSSLYKV
jgi:hypothetical protein